MPYGCLPAGRAGALGILEVDERPNQHRHPRCRQRQDEARPEDPVAQPGAAEAQPESTRQGGAAEQHQLGAISASHFAAVHQDAQADQARVPAQAELGANGGRRQAARYPHQTATQRRRRSVGVGHGASSKPFDASFPYHVPRTGLGRYGISHLHLCAVGASRKRGRAGAVARL